MKKLFIISVGIITLALCAFLFTLSYSAGAKKDAAKLLDAEIAAMNKDAAAVKESGDALRAQIDDLSGELDVKNSVNSEYVENKKLHDTLTEEIDGLKAQSADLDSQIETQRSNISMTGSAEINEGTPGRSYALKKDEMYSCPDKIPAGRYRANGGGTIIVSNSSGATQFTRNLDVTYNNTYTFNLSENQKIKVTGDVTLTELK